MLEPLNEQREHKKRLTRRDDAAAWELFERAPSVRFAGVRADGSPLMRSLTAVVVDGRLCFHGADAGEKLELIGGLAVASVDEIVAQVASYWIHPELACPASTYYLSAFAEGPVELVRDPERKARILTALMARFQPEGRFAPIVASDKRYHKVLEELMVAELVPTRVSAKYKLGQHRSRTQIERVLEGLWRRGAPGDVRAIRLVKDAHPEAPEPAFLRGPRESTLCVAPDAEDARQVAQLLRGQYWTLEFSDELMQRAQLGSAAWVVARSRSGEVIASARAVSDGARFAWILDMIVRPDQQRAGFARALLALLLDHPRLRDVSMIGLRTRDAHDLYAKFGFVRLPESAQQMILKRVQPA